MRVLVVGCGYLGLPLGAELVRRGHDVWGLRRPGSAPGDLQAAGIRPLQADITRPGELAGWPREFDWVVNCVASRGGDAEDYRRLYLQGTRHLSQWLASGPLKRFVYTSSTSVYGQTDGSLVAEDSPTVPDAETAGVLLETEKLLLKAVAEGQFPAVILRVAGIYGPGRGYWFKQFLKNAVRIEGDGVRWLNMIHRDDVMGCVIAALETGRPGEIYNAVDDEPVTQLDFFRWLGERLQRPLPPMESGAAGQNRRRGLTNKRISNRKLKTELGYRFKYPSFREGYSVEIARLGLTGERDSAPSGS